MELAHYKEVCRNSSRNNCVLLHHERHLPCCILHSMSIRSQENILWNWWTRFELRQKLAECNRSILMYNSQQLATQRSFPRWVRHIRCTVIEIGELVLVVAVAHLGKTSAPGSHLGLLTPSLISLSLRSSQYGQRFHIWYLKISPELGWRMLRKPESWQGQHTEEMTPFSTPILLS